RNTGIVSRRSDGFRFFRGTKSRPRRWEGTMHRNIFPAISPGSYERAERAQSALLAKRRRYNRLYMRSWRADPSHQAYERANRERWHYERKLRSAMRIHHAGFD